MENNKQERRRAVRIEKSLFVQYQDDINPDKWDMSGIKNFSEAGMSITTEKQFTSGVFLSLRLKLPSNPFDLFELKGRVVACTKRAVNDSCGSSLSGYTTQIEFLNATDQQKESIREYVNWFIGRQNSQKKEGGAK